MMWYFATRNFSRLNSMKTGCRAMIHRQQILPAILAYYVNIILGFDYGSFSLRGGDNYFKKAWNIVNNAPESSQYNWLESL